MAAIFYVSSLPQPVVPPGGDKPWHLLAYLGLGVLVLRAVVGGLPAWIGRRAAAVAIAIAVGYAVTDELHQMFVPKRTGSPYDSLLDTFGAAVGALLFARARASRGYVTADARAPAELSARSRG